jgi:hypothetical protein
MRWRRQIEALLCAVLLLATLGMVAIRTLAPVTARDDSVPQTLSSKAKAPPDRATRFTSFEIETPWDKGSFWDDEAPAYDLSQPAR